MEFRFNDEDRERLGAPEVLELTLQKLSVRDAEVVEEHCGMTADEAVEQMRMTREELPDGKARLRFKPRGIRLTVWLALRKAGVDVPFEELEFSYLPFIGALTVEPEGKAEPPTGGGPTRSKSRTSGRATRSKTSKTST